MKQLQTTAILLLLVLLAAPSAVADPPETAGTETGRVRLHLKAGSYLDVQGPIETRGSFLLFRLNGQLVSFPSAQVAKTVPIEEPAPVVAPKAEVVDPDEPVRVYEIRGDSGDDAEGEAPAPEEEPETPAPAEDGDEEETPDDDETP